MQANLLFLKIYSKSCTTIPNCSAPGDKDMLYIRIKSVPVVYRIIWIVDVFYKQANIQFCSAFIDGCKNKQCPSGSSCVNIPGGSVTCRCTKPGHRIVNNKCVAKLGRIIKVVGLKFDQTYKDSYKDTNSESFKAKAAEIENVLMIVICHRIIGCVGISVISIKPGSIAVDYSVIIDKGYENVTDASVLEVSKKSLDDEQMSALRVNRTSPLSAESE